MKGYTIPRTADRRRVAWSRRRRGTTSATSSSSTTGPPRTRCVASSRRASTRIRTAAAARPCSPTGSRAREGGDELLDPVRSHYREFFIVANALLDGEEVTTCPFIWVDQDFALARGWIQGFPKKLGEVWMTRTFGLGGPADPGLVPGARHGATCSARGRAIADMTLTIEGVSTDGPRHNAPPIVNVRHFPRLAAGRHDEPQVHELVRAVSRDRLASTVTRARRR